MNPSVITISRQYGSGGREIGRLLAQELKVPFYDKQLFSETAQRSGIHAKFLEEAEQRHGGQLIAYLYDGVTGVSKPLCDQAFLAQVTTMRVLAQEGPCIIVGRGANRILQDRGDVLNVYLYATLEVRIK